MVRFASSVLTVSWIPSEAISGMTKLPFEMGVTQYDEPPPDTMHDFGMACSPPTGSASPTSCARGSRSRTTASSTAATPDSGHINVSTIRVGRREPPRFAAVPLPDIQHDPRDGSPTRSPSPRWPEARAGLPSPRSGPHAAVRPVRGADRVDDAPPHDQRRRAPSSSVELSGRARSRGTGSRRRDGAGRAKTGSIDFKSWWRELLRQAHPLG